MDGTQRIINTILKESQPRLVDLFREKFDEEIESEAMLELIVSIQLYAAGCMRTLMAVVNEENR